MELNEYFKEYETLQAGSIVADADDQYILIALADADFEKYSYGFASMKTGKLWKLLCTNVGTGVTEKEFGIFRMNGVVGFRAVHIPSSGDFESALYGYTHAQPRGRGHDGGFDVICVEEE